MEILPPRSVPRAISKIFRTLHRSGNSFEKFRILHQAITRFEADSAPRTLIQHGGGFSDFMGR